MRYVPDKGQDELAIIDPEAGAAFYAAIFGWEATEATPDESNPYWMLTKDGKKCAGLGGLSPEQQEQGIPPAWSSYVTVDDIGGRLRLQRRLI